MRCVQTVLLPKKHPSSRLAQKKKKKVCGRVTANMANTDITFDEHIQVRILNFCLAEKGLRAVCQQKELLAQARIQASIHNLLGICWKT